MSPKSNAGQATMEAILIMTLLFAGVIAMSNYVQGANVLPRLVEEPWAHLAGMIENGIWDTPERGRPIHPNHLKRRVSPLDPNL